ncbi:18803_t:CDS:1, partial [Racocetra persica]
EVSETTIKNCCRAIKIILEISKSEESESDNKFQNKTTDIDDTTILLKDLSAKTNLTIQELTDNIEEYIQIINQLAVTEDILTDEDIIEMIIDEFCKDKTNDDNKNDEELLLP